MNNLTLTREPPLSPPDDPFDIDHFDQCFDDWEQSLNEDTYAEYCLLFCEKNRSSFEEYLKSIFWPIYQKDIEAPVDYDPNYDD